MIKYRDILNTITKLLFRSHNNIPIFTNSEEMSEGECFYVSLNPSINKTDRRYINYRLIYVDIKYFLDEHDDKTKIYDMATDLDKLFNGYITVPEKVYSEEQKQKTRRINIKSNNIKFLKDDISDYLHYSIELEFYDVKDLEFKKPKLMQHVFINDKEVKNGTSRD